MAMFMPSQSHSGGVIVKPNTGNIVQELQFLSEEDRVAHCNPVITPKNYVDFRSAQWFSTYPEPRQRKLTPIFRYSQNNTTKRGGFQKYPVVFHKSRNSKLASYRSNAANG